jgi:DNA-binding response OmpR family regulator
MDRHHPAGPLCVLIVDGDRVAADTWSVLLTSWGHRPLTAYDAGAAWATALAHRPDVVLLGIGSAGEDGWELGRRLLAEPALDGIQVIALADDYSEDDRKKSAAAGILWHLVKPVDPDLVRGLLVPCRFQREA